MLTRLRLLLITGSLLLISVACSPAAAPEPTPDIDAIVSATVAAERDALYQPQLTAPDDGATFQNAADVTLEWDWLRDLREGEAYDVRVWQAGEPDFGITWTDTPQFDLSQWLSQRDPGEYLWSVAVVEGEDGTVENIIGEAAPQRSFTVENVMLPTATPEPTPALKTAADLIRVPPGFTAEVIAHLPELSTAITVITFDEAGDLLVLAQAGQLVRLRDTDSDNIYETRDDLLLNAESDPTELSWAVGLALYENRYYVSDEGRIGYFENTDDDPQLDTYTEIISDLPSRVYPLHSNNGIIFDDAGKLYVGIGSTTDHGPVSGEYPYESAVLRMNPDGSEVEIYATGLRNPYDFTFSPEGDLFTGDNSPDSLDQVMPFYPPEELNHIREGRDYGFPNVYGADLTIREGDPNASEAPVTEFVTSSVTSGLVYYAAEQFPPEYRDGVFVAQYGGFNKEGEEVVFVTLERDGETFTGTWETFATFIGDYKPLDVTVAPDGALFISDWHGGYLFRVTYTGDE